MKACPGHPDRPRRYDLPRGRRRARHGHLLRLRLRRHQHGRGEQEVRARRQDLSTRATTSPSTAPPATSTASAIPTVDASIGGEFGRVMAWADKYRRLKVRTNADTPHDAEQAVQVRRRGHRPVPHRAHVLRGGPHPGHPRDDLLRHRRAAREGARPSSSRCSRATSRPCMSAHGGLSDDRPLPRSPAARVRSHRGS